MRLHPGAADAALDLGPATRRLAVALRLAPAHALEPLDAVAEGTRRLGGVAPWNAEWS